MKSAREWISAVGTALAAVGAVAAVIIALFQLQDQEHARQQEQAAALAQAERAQAAQVSAWPYATQPNSLPISYRGRQQVTYIELINTSNQPVYSAVVNLVFVHGSAAPRTGREQFATFKQLGRPNPFYRTLAVIPPGKSWTWVPGGWAGGFRIPGAEVAFTDQGGRTWVRSASGSLYRIGRPAAEYYGVPQPAGWGMPTQTPPS